MNQKITTIALLTGLVALVGGGLIGFATGYDQGKRDNINTYEECIAAGYPAQESKPERCSVPGGDTFTNTNATETVSIEGLIVCLPHRNPGDVQTLECATGLQTDDGTYYALSAQDDMSLASEAGSEQRFRISGELDSKPGDRYRTDGTLTVTDYEAI